MICVGIDPGKEGCVSRLDTDVRPLGQGLTHYPMPLDEETGEWDPWKMHMLMMTLQISGAEKVAIEECHAFQGQAASSSSSVMMAYGMWLSAIAQRFRKDQLVVVPAHVWKKDMAVTVPIVKVGKVATKAEKLLAYKARKALALKTARELFGQPFATPRGRGLDGQAEASLIALWGVQQVEKRSHPEVNRVLEG